MGKFSRSPKIALTLGRGTILRFLTRTRREVNLQ